MGTLSLPSSGKVYVDSNCVIYSVEKIEPCCSAVDPVWQAARNGSIEIVCSELALLETMVKPVKAQDKLSQQLYRDLLTNSGEVEVVPITRAVLEIAIDLRANHGLKTPDAIHAASALDAGCAAFVTNDLAFEGLPGVAVLVLSRIL